ncbi:MAG: tetratricopeptide (TPR) repeat protein [Verrucomicrobiales bacterium]|jgi:tetratricopeptide (TPR) repeat protein
MIEDGQNSSELQSAIARTWKASGVASFLLGIGADFFTELAPLAKILCLGSGLVGIAMIIISFMIGSARYWSLPAAIMSVCVAAFSGLVWGLQNTSDEAEKSGILAANVPIVKETQEAMVSQMLNRIDTRLAEFQKSFEERIDKVEANQTELTETLTDPGALAKHWEAELEERENAALEAAKDSGDFEELQRIRDRTRAAKAQMQGFIASIREDLSEEARDSDYLRAVELSVTKGFDYAAEFLGAESDAIQEDADRFKQARDNSAKQLHRRLEGLVFYAELLHLKLDWEKEREILDEVAEIAPGWFEARLRLGELHMTLSNFKEAEPHLLAAKDLAVGDDEEATASDRLGHFYLHLGQTDEAKLLFENSLTIRERIVSREQGKDGELGALALKAEALNDVGMALRAGGFLENAEAKYQQALILRESLKKQAEESGDEGALREARKNLAETLNNLGDLRYGQAEGQSNIEAHNDTLAEAFLYHHQSLAIREELYGGDNHPDVAESCNNLAAVHEILEDYEDAIGNYQRAIRIDVAIKGPDHADVATGYSNLGVAQFYLGDDEAALASQEKALVIRRQMKPEKKHPLYALTLYHCAQINFEMRSVDEAKSMHEEALGIRQAIAFEKDLQTLTDLAASLNSLAFIHLTLSEHSEAEERLNRAFILDPPPTGSNEEKQANMILKLLKTPAGRQQLDQFYNSPENSQ